LPLYELIITVIVLSDRWVFQIIFRVKFIKNERRDIGVELGERSHDLVIDIFVVFLGELMGDEPRDCFAFQFDLVVVAFDGDEDFSDALGVDAIVHPFESDSAAVGNKFLQFG
jgi:hypothetical protein